MRLDTMNIRNTIMTERQVNQKRLDTSRTIRAPHGTTLRAKSWLTEAPLRMLMNNLDPDVAEHPHSLVVYGGIGRAARDWDCFDKIVEVLECLEDDQTLLVQSGKPVGVFPTHKNAPRVLIANSNICLLYTSPSPRDRQKSRMPSSA